MKIFYAKSAGSPDVNCNSPAEASLESVMAIFRVLDPQQGFMGVILDGRFTLQLAPQKQSGVRVELLYTSIPAFDAAVVDVLFAEHLIRAAAEGVDVFQVARASQHKWEHLNLA